LRTPEVDVCGGEVVDALVITPVIVMIDEYLDLRFQVCREEVVFQQDAIQRAGFMTVFNYLRLAGFSSSRESDSGISIIVFGKFFQFTINIIGEDDHLQFSARLKQVQQA